MLDDEVLDGAHEARITYRPVRDAILFDCDADSYYQIIEHECQIWGGATTPLIPVHRSGDIDGLYASRLPGSAIDNVVGFEYGAMYQSPLPRVENTALRFRDVQLAVGMFRYKQQDKQRTIETASLSANDKWRGIYAACLGILPERPSEPLVRESQLRTDIGFEDFVRVSRVSIAGSLDDLIERAAADEPLSPRRMSMIHLPYGNAGSSGIRSSTRVFANADFSRIDAGPNVVVVCSADDYRDLALLWNLRGAHGDFRLLPIGLPADECNEENIRRLLVHPRLARNGIAATQIYITSTSLPVARIQEMIGTTESDSQEFKVVPPAELLTFGQPGGFTRSEVLVWTEGEATYIPSPIENDRDILRSRSLQEFALMHSDVSVSESPFPSCEDIRVWTIGGEFYGGIHSTWGRPSNRSEAKRVKWPSRIQIANAVANARGFRFNESEPGKASRLLIDRLTDISWIRHVLHKPLLDLLETMAARQGFGWYKERLRREQIEANPIENIGPTTDDLPNRTFNDFKKALGNNQEATKYWLLWAEKSGLIVKGFELQCPACGAQPWIPTVAFTPPVICRGCGQAIDPPFGDRTEITFKYRIAEPLRRIYEQDAMTHLVASHFFHGMLHGSGLIGLHPGLEIRKNATSQTVEGELDVLLLMKSGEFVPIEVKRTTAGFSPDELMKLDRACDTLMAPWSAVATSQYARDIVDADQFSTLVSRHNDGSYKRIALTYDHILNPRPIWSLDDDPVAWSPMSTDEIRDREETFVKGLMDASRHSGIDWFESELLHRPRSHPSSSSDNS